ncbi:Hypothetical protein GLP15_3783 [Giardia lamblia P15]|uniref:Uncharacterized protein n=1 Tax=Giardia intestinalis (strain P15) TaxID=658858 RepID=E1F234_GIAIA|nr:Hypothetical protein GLP15_3783 [Giardia lamblia P15]
MTTAADTKRIKAIDATIAEKQRKIEHLRKKCATVFLGIKTLLSQGKEDEVEQLKIDLTFIKEDTQNLKYDIYELNMEKQYLQEKIESQRKDKSKKKFSSKDGDITEIEERIAALLKSSEKSADAQEQMERIKIEQMEMETFKKSMRETNPAKRQELVNLYKLLCNELDIPIDENWLMTAF